MSNGCSGCNPVPPDQGAKRFESGAIARMIYCVRMRSTTFIAVGIFSCLFFHQAPSSAAEPTNNAPALSAYSTGIARALPRNVTATLLFSKDLPPEFGPAEKATRALLEQYQAANPTRFKLSAVDPASASGSLQKGACAISPLHFREFRDGDGLDVPVYLGLCLQDGSNRFVVPDVSERPGLEFAISQWLTTLVKPLPTVAFTVGHGEFDSGRSLAKMKQVFEGEFDIVGIDPSAAPIGEKISALVVAGPTEPFGKVGVDAIARYLDGGHPAILLLPSMRLNSPASAKSPSDGIKFDLAAIPATGLEPLLARYGFRVEPGITMAESNAVNGVISFGDSGNALQTLPHYLGLGLEKHAHPVVEDLSSIILSMASPVTVIPAPKAGSEPVAGARVTELLTAPASSWVRRKPFTFQPRQKEPIETGPARNARGLAFAYEGKTRLLVLGSATFLDDEFINLSRFVPTYNNGIWMVVNALHWMNEAPGLSALRPRTPANAGAQPSLGN